MSDWMQRIGQAIEAQGKTLSRWQAGDGQLLVLPHAGRLLGCALPGVDGNLFWHHPDVEDEAKAGAALDGAGGGLGGDRLWLAPEVAFMWRDLREALKAPFDCYDLPPQMDPGTWEIQSESTGHLALAMSMALTDHRDSRQIEVDVRRQFDLIDPPARLPGDVKTCSFTIRNSMSITGGDAGVAAGLWDLLQLPIGGEHICPTPRRLDAPPRSYYEPYREGDVVVGDDAVRFRAKGDHVIKMGMTPEQTTGRMAYVRETGGVLTAVLRSFLPAPGGVYVDVPRSSTEKRGGDALQAFCDDGRFQHFTEMEYHEPAVVVGDANHAHSGMCVTHVIAGPAASVKAATSAWLGVAV